MPLLIENKLITLNSANATKLNSTYNSDVIFNFKGILTNEDDIVSSNICIMNAQIPVSFYTIAEDFDIVYYVGINPIGNTTIFAGNYNFNSLKSLIDADILSLGINLSFNINRANGKVLFTQTAPTNLSFIVFEGLTVAIGLKYAKLFGYNIRTIAPVANQWIAPNPINLLGVKKLLIKSQKLQISSFSSASNNLAITLSTIPVDVPAFSMISYYNQTDLNKSNLQIKIIDQIDISITDENDELINFNNLEWNITLVLENIRLIPEPAPTFRELITETKPFDAEPSGSAPPSLLNENAINDINDLELLNA
jgi:hypothetical protein